MQKLTIVFIIAISTVLGTTLMWSQLSYVQATSNESGTIQCITTPCEFPPPQPLPLPPESDINNDTMTIPKNGTKLINELQNNNNQNEPCISPCPPGEEICIQMCQPIGQQNTAIIESEFQSKPQQKSNFISDPDVIPSDTLTTAEKKSDLEPTNKDSPTTTTTSTVGTGPSDSGPSENSDSTTSLN